MNAPYRPAGRRRHRTRQRARLLELLRASDAHPTAAALHEQLSLDFPRLSVGTVYRNLEVLVEEGLVDEVPSPRGAMRYDANLEPHHHFSCEACGHIQDLELRLKLDLPARVRRKYRLVPHRFRIDFYGLCRDCAAAEDSSIQ